MVDQRPEDELNPPAVEAEAEADGSDREWWDDAAMPWKHKPNRQDIACLAWIGFLGVFSMAMLPLRAWLLGAPERLPWLVGLMGSRTGTAALGSLVLADSVRRVDVDQVGLDVLVGGQAVGTRHD